MGLDMYLYTRGGTNADTGEKIEDEQIGYWRKFNALHSLFLEVGGADPDSNCEEVPLTLEDLEQILDICNKIKNILDFAPKYMLVDGVDHPVEVDSDEYEGDYMFSEEVEDQVIALMPPQDGFFWGSTNIDDYYHYNVLRTIIILENAIELAKQGEEIYYYCWW